MAKDPAVLFYTSDFLSGTFTMSNDQVGKYIRLLCLQHQKGVLSEKDMINVCGTYDEDVFFKFTKTGTTYVNDRMKFEAERRKNFCESRSKSRQGTKNQTNNKKSYVPRMETETENINEDENTSGNENFLVPLLLEKFKSHLPKYPADKKKDYKPLFSIATFLAEQGKLNNATESPGQIIEAWDVICQVIKTDKFYSQKSLSTIANNIQEILQISLNGKSTGKPNYGSKERAEEYDRMYAKRYPDG
jgi:hypothetical protein